MYDTKPDEALTLQPPPPNACAHTLSLSFTRLFGIPKQRFANDAGHAH